VVHDVPLLVENHLEVEYDLVVVVEAGEDVRLARLADSRGMPAAEARSRMAVQATDDQRRAVADVVLTNDGDLATLEAAVADLWGRLVSERGAG
jgi:dephospho-CoA kinase